MNGDPPEPAGKAELPEGGDELPEGDDELPEPACDELVGAPDPVEL